MDIKKDTFDAITLIGPIAPPQWGPAVKNRILLDTLTRFGITVHPVNTLDWKSQPLRMLIRLIRSIIRTHRVILSVSKNGAVTLLPLLALVSFLRPIEILYMPAGGLIAKEMACRSRLLRAVFVASCKRCCVVAVQRNEVQADFKALGVNNTLLLPNFKVGCSIDSLKKPSLDNGMRLVFLSRVREEKGIETLLKALDLLNAEQHDTQLDIFGIMDDEYRPRLDALIGPRHHIRYCGVLPYDKVIPTIANYDLMVFPTLCLTEGFPGVLADAALAGLAVVASDVPCNREILIDGHNALLTKVGDAEDLAEKIKCLVDAPEVLSRLGENNRVFGQQFDVNRVIPKFLDELKKRGW